MFTWLIKARYFVAGLVVSGIVLLGTTNTSILAEVSAALGVNDAIRQILHIGDDDGIEATEHTVRDIDGTGSALDVGTLSVTVDGDFDITGSMDYLQFETGLTAPSWSEGLIFYDDDEKTLAVYNNQSDVTLQLGLELYNRATNNTGITITNGQLIYVSGALGNRSVVSLAKADDPSTSRVLAMATHDVDDNAIGFFTTFGQVNDVNTASDTAGTLIYLSADTAGRWTSTPPVEPNFRILVGTITRQNANDGKIDLAIGPTDVVDHMVMQSLAINDTLSIGERPDFSFFESDGTLEFSGAAIVWDDQQVGLGSVGFGASAPTVTAYKGSEILAFNKAQDNSITFDVQISHRYKQGTDLDFHIHTVHPDADAGNSVWTFTYSWADIGSDFPGESTVIDTLASPADADKHELHDIANMDGTGQTISSFVLCSLERTGTATADTYDDDIYLIGLDFHYQINTIGSRTETAK